jgi:hypothetical protein
MFICKESVAGKAFKINGDWFPDAGLLTANPLRMLRSQENCGSGFPDPQSEFNGLAAAV